MRIKSFTQAPSNRRIPCVYCLLIMSVMKICHQLFLLLLLLLHCELNAQTMPPNIYADSAHAPFLHGVASFDPTATKVILWTKVDPGINSGPMTLTWEVFEDAALTQQLGTGTAIAASNTDWTAKADVDFPSAGQFYWYRWSDGQGHFSPVGRTKTAQGAVGQVRLAVMSCSSVYSGYFNAYQRVANRNDLDLVVHLGDYIYDFVDADEQVRVPSPAPVDPRRARLAPPQQLRRKPYGGSAIGPERYHPRKHRFACHPWESSTCSFRSLLASP